MTFRAGLALKIVFSFVNGLIPSRSGTAGFFWTTILQRPGKVKDSGPFLPSAFAISSLNASKTAATSFLLTPVASEMLLKISVLVGGF